MIEGSNPSLAKSRQLNLETKPRKGDFDRLLEWRTIRFLVPYSRTLYFIDKGCERGVTADLVRDFEQYLNKKYAKQLGKRSLTVILIVATRDKLLSGVAEGLGDIAAGNLTVTEQRRKFVDFLVLTDRKLVQELFVTGPASPQIAALDKLSGKTIHVRKATSYYEIMSNCWWPKRSVWKQRPTFAISTSIMQPIG